MEYLKWKNGRKNGRKGGRKGLFIYAYPRFTVFLMTTTNKYFLLLRSFHRLPHLRNHTDVIACINSSLTFV